MTDWHFAPIVLYTLLVDGSRGFFESLMSNRAHYLVDTRTYTISQTCAGSRLSCNTSIECISCRAVGLICIGPLIGHMLGTLDLLILVRILPVERVRRHGKHFGACVIVVSLIAYGLAGTYGLVRCRSTGDRLSDEIRTNLSVPK